MNGLTYMPIFESVKPGIVSDAKIREIMAQTPKAVLPVRGDCMERAGIESGGWVAVDFTHMPRTPKYGKGGYSDPCLCYAVWPGTKTPCAMVKAYDGRWGRRHMVGTRYDNWKGGRYRIDVGLPAEKIYGVVFAAWGKDGALRWEHDPKAFPLELPDVPTICGVNVGDAATV